MTSFKEQELAFSHAPSHFTFRWILWLSLIPTVMLHKTSSESFTTCPESGIEQSPTSELCHLWMCSRQGVAYYGFEDFS